MKQAAAAILALAPISEPCFLLPFWHRQKASDYDPVKNVVFNPGYEDRIQTTGRRRGGKITYWIEVTTKSFSKALGP